MQEIPAHVMCLLLLLTLTGPALAQIAPSAAELQAYRGLHAAAAKGDNADIEKLVKSGAPIDARDGHARRPLHVAAFMHKPDAARILIQLGADANALEAQQYDIVTIAAVADDVPMLKAALASGGKATNVTSPYQGTALIAAAHLGHDEVVRTLIAAKAPLDHVNNLGWTALDRVDCARQWRQTSYRCAQGTRRSGRERQSCRSVGRHTAHAREEARIQRNGGNPGEGWRAVANAPADR
jgi:hypothetical protein